MSVAPINSKNATLPMNLDELERDELVRLLKRVASERDGLLAAAPAGSTITHANKKQKTSTASTAAAAPTTTTTTAVAVAFNVAATKKRISSTVKQRVKKTAHNWKKKPWTELSEHVPTLEHCRALFEGYTPASETARLVKWELSTDDIIRWLGDKELLIHPVKFDGKVWCFRGSKPSVYACASYDTLQAKYERKTGNLQLKFRTYMVGSGKPDENGLPRFFRSNGGC